MNKINMNGKEIDLNRCSITELNRLLNQINSEEQDVKKELEYILNKLKEE